MATLVTVDRLPPCFYRRVIVLSNCANWPCSSNTLAPEISGLNENYFVMGFYGMCGIMGQILHDSVTLASNFERNCLNLEGAGLKPITYLHFPPTLIIRGFLLYYTIYLHGTVLN
jgi:hypothetical protein